MKISDLLQALDSIAPLALSEPWDHSGLQLGGAAWRCSRVGFCLVATVESVQVASREGCDVLVAHHPLCFSPLVDLDTSRFVAQTAGEAFRLGVAVVGWHTPWDSACGGVNEGLLARAGLLSARGLRPMPGGFGMGGMGEWPKSCPACASAAALAGTWDLSGYRLAGDPTKEVRRVALCGGSGGDLWQDALEGGADLYATSEMKHHQIVEALASGLALMLCDHGEMEAPSMSDLARRVEELGFDVRVLPETPSPYQWAARGSGRHKD